MWLLTMKNKPKQKPKPLHVDSQIAQSNISLWTTEQESGSACGSATASNVMPSFLIVPLAQNRVGLLHLVCSITFL